MTDTQTGRPPVVLINGAPGSGKSTLAALVAADLPLALALDIDQLKFSLGGWRDDLNAAGLQARRLALALIAEQLAEEHPVVLGQYLARTLFIEALEEAAHAGGGRFVEIVLDVSADHLRTRLAGRSANPDRPEQAHNATLVGPDDADRLVASMVELRALRPHAHVVDGNADIATTLAAIRERIGA
ncbi:AAA family ATPase [Aestuariimicrobium soli]|uniref:AAA family ATPase n=1 Tax=Aestuariimicrobium soli TaxID=2035834 RepID=UPI003EB98953